MANQQEPFAPAPPRGYWRLHLDSAAKRARARDRGETRAVDEFIARVDKAADLIARRNPDPKARREGYRNKPAELWAEQFLYFVKDCEEDWSDWERVGPEDQALRDEVLQQIEQRLADAGIDLATDDVQSAAAKMERFTANAAPAVSPGNDAQPVSYNAPLSGNGG